MQRTRSHRGDRPAPAEYRKENPWISCSHPSPQRCRLFLSSKNGMSSLLHNLSAQSMEDSSEWKLCRLLAAVFDSEGEDLAKQPWIHVAGKCADIKFYEVAVCSSNMTRLPSKFQLDVNYDPFTPTESLIYIHGAHYAKRKAHDHFVRTAKKIVYGQRVNEGVKSCYRQVALAHKVTLDEVSSALPFKSTSTDASSKTHEIIQQVIDEGCFIGSLRWTMTSKI